MHITAHQCALPCRAGPHPSVLVDGAKLRLTSEKSSANSPCGEARTRHSNRPSGSALISSYSSSVSSRIMSPVRPPGGPFDGRVMEFDSVCRLRLLEIANDEFLGTPEAIHDLGGGPGSNDLEAQCRRWVPSEHLTPVEDLDVATTLRPRPASHHPRSPPQIAHISSHRRSGFLWWAARTVFGRAGPAPSNRTYTTTGQSPEA